MNPIKKLTYFVFGSVTIAILGGCATFSELNSNVNQAGVKEYQLINKNMNDNLADRPPKSNYLNVTSEYTYVENTDIVKITLTNTAVALMAGGVSGDDAVIMNFSMNANGKNYKPLKCDNPISNGTLRTKAIVNNSLTCYFDKKIFSNLMEIKQFAYNIDFIRPNTGTLETLVESINNPLNPNSVICKKYMELGFTLEQSIMMMWTRMPAKHFEAQVVHNSKEKRENLQKFAQCIQNGNCKWN